MSKLKVTTISDPDNDNTAITVDSSGNVTFAQNATFSGSVTGISSDLVDDTTPQLGGNLDTNSYGIYLGGTAADNLLDDYEEGTFTPVVEGGSTAGTATYSQQVGKYTKVGNSVTVWIRLNYSSGTGSGSLQIKGLPFTVVTSYLPVFNVYTVNISSSSGSFPAGFSNLTSGIQLVEYQTGGNSGPTLSYDGSGEILITGTYPTNA